MPLIIVRQPRSFHCAGVRLLPGKHGNQVTAAQLKALRADLQFQLWQSLGWVVERTSAPKELKVDAQPEELKHPALAGLTVIKWERMGSEGQFLHVEAKDPKDACSVFVTFRPGEDPVVERRAQLSPPAPEPAPAPGPETTPESEPTPEPEPTQAPETASAQVEELGNVISARRKIAACEDPEILLAWYETDTRATVKEAIEKRVKALGY